MKSLLKLLMLTFTLCSVNSAFSMDAVEVDVEVAAKLCLSLPAKKVAWVANNLAMLQANFDSRNMVQHIIRSIEKNTQKIPQFVNIIKHHIVYKIHYTQESRNFIARLCTRIGENLPTHAPARAGNTLVSTSSPSSSKKVTFDPCVTVVSEELEVSHNLEKECKQVEALLAEQAAQAEKDEELEPIKQKQLRELEYIIRRAQITQLTTEKEAHNNTLTAEKQEFLESLLSKQRYEWQCRKTARLRTENQRRQELAEQRAQAKEADLKDLNQELQELLIQESLDLDTIFEIIETARLDLGYTYAIKLAENMLKMCENAKQCTIAKYLWNIYASKNSPKMSHIEAWQELLHPYVGAHLLNPEPELDPAAEYDATVLGPVIFVKVFGLKSCLKKKSLR